MEVGRDKEEHMGKIFSNKVKIESKCLNLANI